MRYIFTLIFLLISVSEQVSAYHANVLFFDFMQDGRYKVRVHYTIPELKEYRESYVIFNKKKEAERFYFAILRGADFYPREPHALRYIEPKLKPTPW